MTSAAARLRVLTRRARRTPRPKARAPVSVPVQHPLPPAGMAAACDRALRRSATRVEASGPGHWRLGFAPATAVDARLESGWLLLDALADESPAASAWDLLRSQHLLPAPSKRALVAGDGAVHLRGEVPLGDDSEAWEPRVARICERYAAALENAPAPGALSSADLGSRADPCEILAESGWAFTVRADGALAVPLEVRHKPMQALLCCNGSGLRAHLEVLADARLSEPQQQALGVILLGACGVVRFVRAVVAMSGESASVRFEVEWPLPGAGDVADALGALWVAGSMFAQEVQAVAVDEALAGAYVEIRGQ